MRQMIRSGLDMELPKLLKNRVYVGISAGSVVAARSLSTSPMFLYGPGREMHLRAWDTWASI